MFWSAESLHSKSVSLHRNLNIVLMLRLKEILKERKMSEQELAKKLGVTRQYVNAIVKERSSCSLDTLAKIAKALDAPVISLFDGYQEPSKPQKLIGTIKIPNSDIVLQVMMAM